MKKVLVVDDNLSTREIISVILRGEGVEVIEADNQKDGWWKFQDHRPDLIITDLEMETPDAGMLLAQKIKMVSPATPVIMVTGVEVEKPAEVDCLFPKPFDIKAFTKAVKKFLEN